MKKKAAVILLLMFLMSAVSLCRCLYNPLNGRDIIVHAGTMNGGGARNLTTGQFLDLGVTTLSINSIAKLMNFTYTLKQSPLVLLRTSTTSRYQGFNVGNRSADPSTGKTLLESLLIKQETDLVIGAFVPTVGRNRLADLSVVFAIETMHFLIPVPETLDNRYAMFKPFTVQVWTWLVVTCTAIVCTFYLFNWLASLNSGALTNLNKSRRNASKAEKIRKSEEVVSDPSLYVLGVILSQGGECSSAKLSSRMIAGSFCLAACVLVYGYSSLLITYVIAPNNPPLIRTVYDLLKNANIKLVVDKERALDIAISQSTETNGTFQQLRERLDKYSHTRCQAQATCVETVLNNRNSDSPIRAVYGSPHTWLTNVTRQDFEATGRKECRVQITSEGFLPMSAAWLLPKYSPYTNAINIGLLRINEAGLREVWSGNYHGMPKQCNGLQPSSSENSPRLAMRNLIGSFLLLAFGCAISFLVFIFEIAASRFKKH